MKRWFTLMDDAIRYGVEQQMILGKEPMLEALEVPEEWAPTGELQKRQLDAFADLRAARLSKAGPVNVQVVDWLADWECIRHEGAKVVGPHQVRIYGEAMGKAAELAKLKTPWNLVNRRAVEWAGRNSALRVTAITEETRAAIRTIIRDGIERGISIPQIGRELRALPTFAMNERQAKALINYRRSLDATRFKIAGALQEANGSVKGAFVALKGAVPATWVKQVKDGAFDTSKRVAKEAAKKVRYRAEMIARTETAQAVSEGTLEGYREAGVEHVRWEAAGDPCEICASYDGYEYTRLEAGGLIPQHPNCRCTWIPVVTGPQVAQAPPEAEVAPPAGSSLAQAPLPGPAAAPEAVGAGEAVPEVAAEILPAPTPPGSSMQSGKITTHQPLGGGCNVTEKIHIDGDGDGVYKPASGEKASLRRSITDGTMYKRERAAYIVDQELGFDLVPETVIKEGRSGIGSVQAWVNKAKVGAEADYSWWGEKMPMLEKEKMNIFDYLTANLDRHAGNWMVNAEGRLFAIDNGLCFADNGAIFKAGDTIRLAFASIHGKEYPMSESIKAALLRLKSNRRTIAKQLKGLLSPKEIKSVWERLDYLLWPIQAEPGRLENPHDIISWTRAYRQVLADAKAAKKATKAAAAGV